VKNLIRSIGSFHDNDALENVKVITFLYMMYFACQKNCLIFACELDITDTIFKSSVTEP